MKISLLLSRARKNWPAKVLSIAAAVVLVLFHNYSRLESRDLSVPLRLELPGGYVPAAPFADRVRLTIRGEPDEIFRISEQDLDVFADLSGHSAEGAFRVPVQVQKLGAALGVDPLEIGVEPLHVTVRLGERITREVDIVPNISGYPPPGYQLGSYVLNPSQVLVTGPRERVAGLESIPTEEINVAGRTEDFVVQVRLTRPSTLVSIPGGEIVEFRASIDESVVLTTFDQIEVVILNLSPELQIESELETGIIRLQGGGQELEGLSPSDMQLIVDASDIDAPGIYELSTRPVLPAGFLVLRYEPMVIELSVTE